MLSMNIDLIIIIIIIIIIIPRLYSPLDIRT